MFKNLLKALSKSVKLTMLRYKTSERTQEPLTISSLKQATHKRSTDYIDPSITKNYASREIGSLARGRGL